MRPMDFTRDDTSDAPPVPAPAAPATQLSYAVATWLQRVDAAAHPKAKLNVAADADPKQTQYRLIYVMAPTSGGRHVALCLYKARLRGTGEVAAASPVSEVFSLLSAPPPFLAPGDEDLVRFFVAMRSGANSQTGSATEPRGKIGAALLQMLSDQEKLLWANSWADVGNGLVYPLKAGVLREANLAWREEGKGLRLGWQVAAAPGARHPGADQIDYMLPTDPPWYIDNLSCGVLQLNQGGGDIPLADLQALVAQAPLLTANDKVRVSQLLLAHGLQHLMPLPQPLPQRLRDDVAPRPILTLDAAMLADGSTQRWHDYAVLSYDYDGERVSFDPSQRVVRQKGAVTEIIQRDEAAEAAALETLTALGFKKPGSLPLSSVKGAQLLPSQAEWLRFAADGIAVLQAQGWQVDKSAKYRYDVSAVDDWYADVEQDPDTGNAWFDLELGIVVNQHRVPLLPAGADDPQRTARFQSKNHRGPRRRRPDAGDPGRRHPRRAAVAPRQADLEHAGRAVFQRQDQDFAAHGVAGRGAPRRAGARPGAALEWRRAIAGNRPQAQPVRRGQERGHAGQPASHPARLPERGPVVDAVPARIQSGRHPGRRHGPGQDRADAGPHPG